MKTEATRYWVFGLVCVALVALGLFWRYRTEARGELSTRRAEHQVRLATRATLPPAPSQPAAEQGIGVSRAKLHDTFSELSFEPSTPAYGYPRTVGVSSDRVTTLECVGANEDLFEASLVVRVRPGFDGKALVRRFMQAVAPDWPEGVGWANQPFPSGQAQRLEVHDQVQFSATAPGSLSVLTVSARSATRSPSDSAAPGGDAGN